MEGTTLPDAGRGRPTVVVIGNEKGGTGKSTTAIHVAISLLQQGYRVASLDLDPRQRTLSRYIANRVAYAAQSGRALPTPVHTVTDPLEGADASATIVARARLATTLRQSEGFDYLVVDTPGSASALSRAAHEVADTLITPLNDSLIDIDVLAQVDWERRTVLQPSVYTRFVWECRDRRANSDSSALDWIVIRNRLPHIESRNKRDITALMELLARHIGFRLAGGFGERVVFRELFSRGLTVLDVAAPSGAEEPSSHRAARAELDALLEAMRRPQLAAA